MNGTIQIHGNNAGQVAYSDNGAITQTGTFITGTRPDPLEAAQAREWLEQMLEALNNKIAAEVPTEKQPDARERVGEFKEALLAPKPDLTTMEYVRNWFIKYAPRLAGDISGLIIHPIVGKLVEAAGEMAVGEFRRRFLPSQP